MWLARVISMPGEGDSAAAPNAEPGTITGSWGKCRLILRFKAFEAMCDKRVAAWAWTAACLALCIPAGAAQEEGPTNETVASRPESPPRYRIDFGGEFFDAAEGRTASGLLGFTWVPHPSHALSLTLPFVGADFSETEGSGIGDVVVQYSWAPSVQLDANPWFPRSIGMGLTLILPSGDPDKGIGSDRWVAIPNFGWVVSITRGLSFLPLLQYFRSFDEMSDEEELDLINLELGFVYVTPIGLWVNYTPSIFEDLDSTGDNSLDHSLTLGKQIRWFGLSVGLATIERPDQQKELSRGADYQASITFHLTLP